jgi:hypothetical protein
MFALGATEATAATRRSAMKAPSRFICSWSALRRQTAIQATRWRQSGGRQTRSLKPNGIPGVCGHDRRIGETLDSRLFNLGGERSSG